MPELELEIYNFTPQYNNKIKRLTQAAEDLLKQDKHFTAKQLWKHAGFKGGIKGKAEQKVMDYANHQSELSFLKKVNRHKDEIKHIGKHSNHIDKAISKVRKLLGFSYIPFIVKCKIEYLLIDSNPKMSIE